MLFIRVSLPGFIISEQKVVLSRLSHHLSWCVMHYWVILWLGMVCKPLNVIHVLVDHLHMHLVAYGAFGSQPIIWASTCAKISPRLWLGILSWVVVRVISYRFLVLLFIHGALMATSCEVLRNENGRWEHWLALRHHLVFQLTVRTRISFLSVLRRRVLNRVVVAQSLWI